MSAFGRRIEARFPVMTLLPIALFVSACSSSGDARNAPSAGAADAADAAVDGAPSPSLCVPTDVVPGAGACELDVTVVGLATANGCYVDLAVKEKEVGRLRWDCTATDGAAQIVFQEHTFNGLWHAPTFEVCLGTSFLYADGCNWGSAQHIVGEPTHGAALTFTYAEAPTDEKRACSSSCSANGTLQVAE